MIDSSTVFISEPITPEEFESYYFLRYQLLRKPWKQPLGSEKDENEEQSIHIIASDENKKIIGVCRLQFNSPAFAQIRYMAVSNEMHGKGIGKKLIYYAENKAKQNGATKIILHSRANAVEFYKKCGYTVVEKSYLMWEEIQHYLMEKSV